MSEFFAFGALLGLATLTLMEIVLGIDNVVFIAILVAKLPASQQNLARRLGLTLALGIRILLLLTISWIMGLTRPLLTVWEIELSGRSLILLAGGLFLIFKATREIYEKVEAESHERVSGGSGSAFGWVLFQILLLDIVFSLDGPGHAGDARVGGDRERLRRAASEHQDPGTGLPPPHRRDAGGRGHGHPHGEGLRLLRDGVLPLRRDAEHALPAAARGPSPRAGLTMPDDRTALVTGAARGIGLAIARRLAGDGLRVALLDLDRERVETAAREVGSGAAALVADVTRSADVDAAVRVVVERWGRLDVLVNNAGITGRSFPVWELEDADWERVLAVDLTSVFYCCRAAIRVMLRQGSGRIVNIASIAGKEGNPTLVPYSSAKAGVIGLTKALAKEVATRGILVNAVAPAVIGTELLQQMERSTVDLLISKIPMGRVGRPEEVAALVAWLASEECSFSTGAVYDLSGGRATY
jgi:2-dehydro-3-deoxy-L-rhamnonate dehydrogenase (NAD+)